MTTTNKSSSCYDCIHSHITLLHNYLKCELNGNCYIPSVMKDKISEDCPIYKKTNEEIKHDKC